MKRKLLMWGVLSVLLFLTACGKKGQTKEPAVTAREEALSEKETENTGSFGIPIRIYHSDDKGENLCVSTARTEEITPEILLLNLSFYHMVPDTMTVQEFGKKNQEDGLLLTLDLPQEFQEYLSRLSGQEETLVMGSMVNTFLDAYQGTAILITVEGAALSTDYGIYEEALERYPYQEASYQIVEKELLEGQIQISYPQLVGLLDEEIQKKWNEIISGHAKRALEDAEEGSSLEAGYSVKTMNDQLLSILIEGYYSRQGGAYPIRFRYTYNIDMSSGESLRLAYYQNPDELAEVLLSGEGYRVEGELGEELKERLSILYGTAEQLADVLRDFDYGDNRETPSGFSYQEKGQTHLCIEVPHVLGDCVDVVLEKNGDSEQP
ncbi:MAG: DUF4163 domain-containing protein [Lachnospiraceae bacterium]|nr:DUF4163 domain-containing protein [Lachnospiraceae bacterium]MCI9623937.1 DUF4163 domain-containing protein [Lachnospiraceae bacterium]